MRPHAPLGLGRVCARSRFNSICNGAAWRKGNELGSGRRQEGEGEEEFRRAGGVKLAVALSLSLARFLSLPLFPVFPFCLLLVRKVTVMRRRTSGIGGACCYSERFGHRFFAALGANGDRGAGMRCRHSFSVNHCAVSVVAKLETGKVGEWRRRVLRAYDLSPDFARIN